jgi:thioredoxin 1
MPVKTVNDLKTFQAEVENAENIVIKFEADWCSPCKAMKPIVEDFARNNPQTKVLAVDVEGDGIFDILKDYGVRSVPTFVRVKNGSLIKTATGAISRAELSSFAEE